MKKDLVAFKGVSEGVYLDVIGNDLEAIKSELNQKFRNSSKFFKGAKFLGVRSDELTEDQVMEIKLTLKYKYEMNISNEGLPEYIKTYYYERTSENTEKIFEGVEEGMTKFVHGTLRSGQEVDYEGNIVVIGDVNPGAFLKAEGNIVVLGTLRGVAHAGVGGNYDSIVAAYNLLPMQLRIGDIIARPPDDDTQYKFPEIAKIIDGEVLIEPYLPNK
ncbi:septum site-determining protein MinC [Tissierella sp. Yu-01]|uniref:septum site-determining protein MinC n=1 Tax=Tissierella sp. Yu-01 TaxID=3035694 RepID=UPI00240E06A8|nr:septum site-determining protein MinC [Tissierella sp. Yu-01]WFA09491.1 septum site-determining protein MinC [Tissierella sp. Yu-01]